MVLLSLALEEGRGVLQDEAEVLLWMRRAAEAGSSDAVFNLALACEQGWGVAVDLAEAARLYAAAEAAGEPDGFCALARLHEEGRGVPRDPNQARRLYLRAFGAAMEAADARQGEGGSEASGRSAARLKISASPNRAPSAKLGAPP